MRAKFAVLITALMLATLLASVHGGAPAEARVKPRVAFSVAEAPVAQTRSGLWGRTMFQGKVKPARKGAKVFLERRTSRGWRVVGVAKQTRKGTFRGMYVAADRERLRVRTKARGVKRWVMSKARTRVGYRLRFNDDFNGTRLDSSKWYTRHQPMMGNRMCAQPHSNLVTVQRGVANLRVMKFDTRSTKTCPYGRFYNAMVGTKSPYRYLYGTFAARVKFQDAQGMHGAFWLQGPADSGVEIDTAEYFGDASPAHEKLTVKLHHVRTNKPLTTFSRGGYQLPTQRILGKGRKPSDGYHVYSVNWSPSGYVFRLDGHEMVRLPARSFFVSRSPQETVLSLLTSDWELKRLSTTNSVMQVDWVRVWQR